MPKIKRSFEGLPSNRTPKITVLKIKNAICDLGKNKSRTHGCLLICISVKRGSYLCSGSGLEIKTMESLLMNPQNLPVRATFSRWLYLKNAVLKSPGEPQYFVPKEVKIFFTKTPLLLNEETIYNKTK